MKKVLRSRNLKKGKIKHLVKCTLRAKMTEFRAKMMGNETAMESKQIENDRNFVIDK